MGLPARHCSTVIIAQSAERPPAEAHALPLPTDLDYFDLGGLNHEAAQRLARVRPTTTAQAARIPGITPAAVMTVWAHARVLARRASGAASL